jgi:3-oxoacyl-[acyl-carrier-protein] synthase III
MPQQFAQITGWGMYVPPRVVPNDAFVKMGLDTTDEWISSRTGIQTRRIVGDESTSDMAVRAAREALHIAEVPANEIDLVLVATCTPDHMMPATASLVQDRLGAAGAGAMDINAACAGFVYALISAASFIESGRSGKVLVIGADELSLHLDWKDRGTCVLFGDGAGAVVLERAPEPGIMSSDVGSDGSGANLLTIPAGSRHRHHPTTNGNGASPSFNSDYYLRMNGPQIFRWATQMMARAAEKVMRNSGLQAADVDLFIPHQANFRIMEATAKRLDLPLDRVFSNVRDYGNTSAASIPIALCEAIASGRIKVGDNLVLTSFGAGLSWAAVAMRWGAAIPAQVSRWRPIRYGLENRMSAVRSALRRQEWRVRGEIDKRFRNDEE